MQIIDTPSRTRRNPLNWVVGKNIYFYSKIRNVTQLQLAEVLGVTVQQIQKYMSAKNRISAADLYLIAKFLNADIKNFFKIALHEEPKDHATLERLHGKKFVRIMPTREHSLKIINETIQRLENKGA